MRAIVVDDSKLVRTVIRRILVEQQIEVVEAEHGKQALDYLRAAGPADLMLVDRNMPLMNGIELIRAVRMHDEYDAMPIMVVSSETTPEAVAEAMEAGANDYLNKPFTQEAMLTKLENLGVSVTPC